ncbi:MAG: helix-turn-helix domain-containing protein [Actinomycetes bacterium]
MWEAGTVDYLGGAADSWRQKVDDDSPAAALIRDAAEAMDLEQLCDLIVARCVSVAFATYVDDDEFRAHLRASVLENLRQLRNYLTGRVTLADISLREPLSFATFQAKLGIAQSSIHRSYRVSFLTSWREFTTLLNELVADDRIERDVAFAAFEGLTDKIFKYQDQVASMVAETYTQTDDALSRSKSYMRQRLVREVLNGVVEVPSPSDVSIIGYDLDGAHAAILLPDTSEESAAQVAVKLKSAVQARDVLVYPLNLKRSVLWLGRGRRWTPQSLRALRDQLVELGLSASISDPQEGMTGFRLSFQQVREVEKIRFSVGQTNGSGVMLQSEVGLEILLLRDLDMAKRFIQAELGPLALDTRDNERLRETLDASFRFGSHVAAAEYLQLHEHTVRNRLQKAEQLLGSSIRERSTELQVALRLRRVLSRSR